MMTEGAKYEWDAFVSYSHEDHDWVVSELLPRLRAARIGGQPMRVCIDEESFQPGAPIVTEIEHAVLQSRKTLLILSPAYLKSDWATFESIMVSTLDPANRQRRLLPVLVKKCKLPLRIRGLIYIDLSGTVDADAQFNRLLRAIGGTEDWLLDELYSEGREHYTAHRWQKALGRLRQVQAIRHDYSDVAELIADAEVQKRRQQRRWLIPLGAVAVLIAAIVLLRNFIWPPNPRPPAQLPIAFVSERDGNAEVYSVRPDGSSLMRLTKDPASDAQAVWAPGGTGIAFISDRTDAPEIYVMDADGTDVRRLTNTGGGEKWFSWCRDGKRIVFEWKWAAQDHRDIYTVNRDGSAQTIRTDRAAEHWNASWSPDGKNILFVVKWGTDPEIVTMDLNTAKWTFLTDNSFWDQLPAWSPDGLQIAFVSRREGVWRMLTINSDGSGEHELVANINPDSYAAWSPDGRRVAVVGRADGQDDVYVMNADGSGEIRLTSGPGFDGKPVWSPDGRQIAFESDRDGQPEIYAVNADGSGSEVRVTTGGGHDPSWAR